MTYDTDVHMDFSLTNMTKKNREKTTEKVKKIKDGSSTNLSGGLIKGQSTPILSYKIGTLGEANNYVHCFFFITHFPNL